MAQPAISEEPVEFRILESAKSLLAGAVGAAYVYDASAAYIVAQPHTKLLGESGQEAWPTTLYLVSPGQNNASDYTQCATAFLGDFLVTACVPVGTPELPWETGHVEVSRVQLRMAQDIYTALHLKEIEGATLRVENRNLDIEVDGWAIVQVQVAFEYSEVDPA